MTECTLTSGEIVKDLASQNTTKSIKRRDSSVQYSIGHSIIAHPVQKASNTSKVLFAFFCCARGRSCQK